MAKDSKKQLVREHEKLVVVLKNKDPKQLEKERKKQAAELAEMKKKGKK